MVTSDRGLPLLRYQVYDEFGQFQPSGSITIRPIEDGRASYGARFGLSDLRDLHNPGGRRYLIVVTARDQDGARQASTVVTVPPAGFFFPTRPPKA
jgi:hypothetical protein